MSEENKNSEFSFENESYRKTYWHTCSHILAQAVKRLYPEVKLAIGPSIDEGFFTTTWTPLPLHSGGSWRSLRERCARSARRS